ncbi:MAG: DNA repair protein RecN [Alphaproteobacteria bacterium]
MLVSLAIRKFVVIDSIDLTFRRGLCVLTGETGAGKSILLDSLGLALGGRANASAVRPDRDGAAGQAAVTAEFVLDSGSPVYAMLDEHGLDAPEQGESLFLRRTIAADGRSRAFINDQPVGVALLRSIGQALVEIEGQFASHGLMDPASHMTALDSFASLGAERDSLNAAWRHLREADAALAATEEAFAKARTEEDYLRHVAGELAALDAGPGEEQELADTRSILMNAEAVIEGLNIALQALNGADGVEAGLGKAQSSLTPSAAKAAGRLDSALAALERAANEAADATGEIESAAAGLQPDPERLETVEERLFALRGAARKHNVAVDDLPALAEHFRTRLDGLERSDNELKALAEKVKKARSAYVLAAAALSEKRQKAAIKLDKAMAKELPPLRLDKAVFTTAIARLEEDSWSADGMDEVYFEVSTNPGLPAGPLARIASGGELARFLLALKVVLQQANAVPTLIFDEVDTGIGGSTASAVGERLAQLGESAQIMAVTHSPQVAAFGAQHLRVVKNETSGGVSTAVDELSDSARREEIARMLAGASITDEARAAADSLIAGGS